MDTGGTKPRVIPAVLEGCAVAQQGAEPRLTQPSLHGTCSASRAQTECQPTPRSEEYLVQ